MKVDILQYDIEQMNNIFDKYDTVTSYYEETVNKNQFTMIERFKNFIDKIISKIKALFSKKSASMNTAGDVIVNSINAHPLIREKRKLKDALATKNPRKIRKAREEYKSNMIKYGIAGAAAAGAAFAGMYVFSKMSKVKKDMQDNEAESISIFTKAKDIISNFKGNHSRSSATIGLAALDQQEAEYKLKDKIAKLKKQKKQMKETIDKLNEEIEILRKSNDDKSLKIAEYEKQRKQKNDKLIGIDTEMNKLIKLIESESGKKTNVTSNASSIKTDAPSVDKIDIPEELGEGDLHKEVTETVKEVAKTDALILQKLMNNNKKNTKPNKSGEKPMVLDPLGNGSNKKKKPDTDDDNDVNKDIPVLTSEEDERRKNERPLNPNNFIG